VIGGNINYNLSILTLIILAMTVSGILKSVASMVDHLFHFQGTLDSVCENDNLFKKTIILKLLFVHRSQEEMERVEDSSTAFPSNIHSRCLYFDTKRRVALKAFTQRKSRTKGSGEENKEIKPIEVSQRRLAGRIATTSSTTLLFSTRVHLRT
jgi:hypothetical protein